MPRRQRIRDSDGALVKPGDKITFSYGIPFVNVIADVIVRDGRLIALCPGHNPPECPVDEIREYVGDFYLCN